MDMASTMTEQDDPWFETNCQRALVFLQLVVEQVSGELILCHVLTG